MEAKGKGIMRTFWCETRSNGNCSSATGSSISGADSGDSIHDKGSARGANPHYRPSPAVGGGIDTAKQVRLVNWIVDMLHEHIKKVVVLRQTRTKSFSPTLMPVDGQNSLEEVAEVIYLPRFNQKTFADAQNASEVHISFEVLDQLKDYISAIANLYRDNAFHNFGECKSMHAASSAAPFFYFASQNRLDAIL